MADALITTTFMVLSDTHDFDFSQSTETSPRLQLPTTPVDVLLHCGDLTQVGGMSSFKKAINMIGRIDAELKLVIAGNHDLELDKPYWQSQCEEEGGSLEDAEDHDQAMRIVTGPLAADAGVTFLNEGTYTFSLSNGAEFTIYVSPYTPAFGDWAFGYAHDEDRFNASHQVANDSVKSIAENPIPDNVDIVMTHGPPKSILDWCPQGNVGCEILLQAIRRVEPVMHCFGHIHESHGAALIDWEDGQSSAATGPPGSEVYGYSGEDTLIGNPYPEPFVWRRCREQMLAVNAAIMTGDNKPENAPWLIQLDLPRSSSRT